MASLEDYPFRHDGILYCFKMQPELATFLSQKSDSNPKGLKVFKDVELLEAIIPGSKNQVNSSLVDDHILDSKGIREHYEKWKSGAGAGLNGQPLSTFDDLTGAQVKSLEANGFNTVEALAEMDDSLLPILGPNGRTLRDKARAMIGFSTDEGVKALKAENASMAKQLEEMRAQIAALAQGGVPKAPATEPKGKAGKNAKAEARDPLDPFGTEQAA
jgi:hypothetical protein